jgi:class 3 adenylate cyclase
MVPHIGSRLRDELLAAEATDCYASGTCGGDILFLEAALSVGARAHMVLYSTIPSFRADCVDIIPGADWGRRFDQLLERGVAAEILADQVASKSAVASDYCNRIVVGLAAHHAREHGEEPLVLALWDGQPGDAVGGTHSIVQFCIERELRVRWMQDLIQVSDRSTIELRRPRKGTTSNIERELSLRETPQHICATIFADVAGFSLIKERQVPTFVYQFLGSAMAVMQARNIVPLVKNTWGDALYLVFESMRDAGIFALDFRDSLSAVPWQQQGFSYAPSVRIGIHAGPLYRIYDPVIGLWTYVGSHVTRAARLEPSTEPGRVFATLAFAALAAADGVTDFICSPLGKRQLVKNGGPCTIFELFRTESACQSTRA